jgi:hypothetical protein
MKIRMELGDVEGTPEEITEFLKLQSKRPTPKRQSTVPSINKRTWSQWEVELIKKQYGKVPVKQITDTLGRSYRAVVDKANSLGLNLSAKPYKNRSRQPNSFAVWTSEEIELLKAFCNKGMSVQNIARHLGRSKSSVYTKMNMIGVSNKH